MASALDRAVEYLSQRPLEHDELWFVHQGSRRLPAPFPAWARTLEPVGEAEWAERILEGLRDLELWEPPPSPRPAGLEPERVGAFQFGRRRSFHVIASMLMFAGTCAPERPKSIETLRNLVDAETHGYVLTHQAWALVVGVSRGCLDPEAVLARRDAMARRLLAELLASRGIDDLETERMAVLCLLGAGSWIPESLWERLLDGQQPSGSWGSVPPAGTRTDSLREEHTVALAFFALAHRWRMSQQDVAASARRFGSRSCCSAGSTGSRAWTAPSRRASSSSRWAGP